ncbi:hypothetical protein HJC23_009909 [Cyclotella cryptica]|uniref:PPPDE domain-containing protein n=1 Tax=Cyclotella cryptica TaxID=29204 RepID=A0ABD3QBN0_9STRA|eukprot:CCRYP_007035-RA/>CCRYP_007035-RA protein AED:0.04 eAED:0.04 QI:68/1/1/1/1/1/2/147/242
MDNVVLNVYDLLPTTPNQSQAASQASSMSSVFSVILNSFGMGAYHTSIDVRGFRYQFGSVIGISRTSAPVSGGETAESLRFMPPNVTYRESIILGQTWFERSEINAIVQRMREDKFTGDKYHLANRNCNHFSETFAMALIFGDALLEENNNNFRLEKYPAWINRLAKTGTALGIDDGNVCNVLAEARIAAGVKNKVGWGISSKTFSQERTNSASSTANKSHKKALTEKQKAVLSKFKKTGNK